MHSGKRNWHWKSEILVEKKQTMVFGPETDVEEGYNRYRLLKCSYDDSSTDFMSEMNYLECDLECIYNNSFSDFMSEIDFLIAPIEEMLRKKVEIYDLLGKLYPRCKTFWHAEIIRTFSDNHKESLRSREDQPTEVFSIEWTGKKI